MIDPILSEGQEKMERAVEILKRDLAAVRTGRASPGLVENLRVDYYGVPTPLQQLATVSAPEARLLVIQPWDTQLLPTIEKAIMKSELGLMPSNDGRVIRLPVPPLTEERRRELTRIVKRRVEEGKVEVRNLRRDVGDSLRKMERSGDISEDDHRRALERLQKTTDRYIAVLEQIGQEKETELLTV